MGAYEDAKDIYLHRVNLWSAITDEQYFVKQVAASELKMSMRIVARKKAKQQSEEEMGPAELLALLKDKEKVPPKEYLYRTVIPALLPALEVCQRDRPEDPISFIASTCFVTSASMLRALSLEAMLGVTQS